MSPRPSKTASATLAAAVQTAAFFKFGADPNRSAIVLSLGDGDLDNGELARAAGLGPSAVTHALSLLRMAKLIDSRRGRGACRHALTDRGRTLLGVIRSLASAG